MVVQAGFCRFCADRGDGSERMWFFLDQGCALITFELRLVLNSNLGTELEFNFNWSSEYNTEFWFECKEVHLKNNSNKFL